MIFNIHNVQGYKSSGSFDGLGWSRQADGSYTQTINVSGVKADSDLIISPTPNSKEAYNAMGCIPIGQANNSITFKCYRPDDIAVSVEVIILNF